MNSHLQKISAVKAFLQVRIHSRIARRTPGSPPCGAN